MDGQYDRGYLNSFREIPRKKCENELPIRTVHTRPVEDKSCIGRMPLTVYNTHDHSNPTVITIINNVHNNLQGLNEGNFIHLTLEEKERFDNSVQQDIVNNEIPFGPLNGINAIFTTQFSVKPGSEEVYVNGVRQKTPDDYSISGQTITFLFSPQINEEILIDYIKQ